MMSRLRDHAQAIALAEPGVGDANHGGMQDLGVGVEDLLDLAGKELLAAAIDDLLAPTDDLDIELVVDSAPKVAAAEPAIGGEGLRVGGGIVVVAEMHARAARGDLADGAVRQLLARLVED